MPIKRANSMEYTKYGSSSCLFIFFLKFTLYSYPKLNDPYTHLCHTKLTFTSINFVLYKSPRIIKNLPYVVTLFITKFKLFI